MSVCATVRPLYQCVSVYSAQSQRACVVHVAIKLLKFCSATLDDLGLVFTMTIAARGPSNSWIFIYPCDDVVRLFSFHSSSVLYINYINCRTSTKDYFYSSVDVFDKAINCLIY